MEEGWRNVNINVYIQQVQSTFALVSKLRGQITRKIEQFNWLSLQIIPFGEIPFTSLVTLSKGGSPNVKNLHLARLRRHKLRKLGLIYWINKQTNDFPCSEAK